MHICSWLQQPTPDLAWPIAIELANLGGDSSFRALLEAVTRGVDQQTRVVAVHALGLMAEKRAADLLARVLENRNENPQITGEAAEALGFCAHGSPRAFSALMKALDDSSVEVRYFAAYALGRLGDARAIDALERHLNDTDVAPGFGSVAEEVGASLRSIRDHRGTI